MSCERVVPTEDLLTEGPSTPCGISRMVVDGVIEAPAGAHFTSCAPDYGRDEAFQREYAQAAADAEAWAAFSQRYLELASEDEYRRAVAAR